MKQKKRCRTCKWRRRQHHGVYECRYPLPCWQKGYDQHFYPCPTMAQEGRDCRAWAARKEKPNE